MKAEDFERAREMLSNVEETERCLLLTEAGIRANWGWIEKDPDNPRPGLNCEQWIAEAQAGRIVALGARVVIQEKLSSSNPRGEGRELEC